MADVFASKFFLRRSLSFRLYALIIPVTVLTISLLSYLDSRTSRRMVESHVEESTIHIATQLADDLVRGGKLAADENLRILSGQLLEANYYVTRIAVYQISGGELLLLHTTSTSPGKSVLYDEQTAVNEMRLLVVRQFQQNERFVKAIAPIVAAGRAIGCVAITSSLRESDQIAEFDKQIAILEIPLAVIVLVALLHFSFTRVMTGRINRLALSMTQARGGDLEHRARIDQEDEIGMIARRFNDLMDEVARASRERDRLLDEVQNFNVGLQARVGEATRELSTANEMLRQANEDLVETQGRLTQAERMSVAGQMASTFAHEIGSPLSALSTHLQLLLEDPGLTEASRGRLRLVQEQVHRITGSVEDLLAETHPTAQARTRVQVNQLLEHLLSFLEQHLQRLRVELKKSLADDLPEILANSQQLQQVFLNLLNNACDAMPSGGRVLVETRAEPDSSDNRFVVVEVTDNGLGISEEQQRHIFEPFFTTKKLRQGTGLGLSIASSIIRQHGGTITVNSGLGKGATLTVRLPRMIADSPFDKEKDLADRGQP